MVVARFPTVSGEALDGTPFVAPCDLAGARTFAVFGFAMDQRAELETWVPFLDELARSGQARARLFLPLAIPKLLRGGVLKAMRAAVSQPELRASTIPLFGDVGAICGPLAISDRDHIVILLIEPDGTVGWRSAGAFSPAKGAAASAALTG